MSRQKLELYLDTSGEFRWRLVSNRKIIAESGEGYKKRAGARAGFKAAAKAFSHGDDLSVVDLTKPPQDE